jgi:putative nucleotidyltransferase with HDIG domain
VTPVAADARPRPLEKALVDGMAAVERFPTLGYSRGLLIDLLDGGTAPAHETVAVIESDPALAIRVLSLANRGRPPGARPICGIPDGVAEVGRSALQALVRDLPVFDFFGERGAWSEAAQHFRVHGVAVRCGAERLIRDGLAKKPDQLRVAALLHDVGKLVVLHAYGHYTTGGEGPACDRLLVERRAWGIDHPLVGGVVARRLGLPNPVARLIERHHSDDEDGDTALLRLADILVHYAAGHPVDRRELIAVAESSGLAGAGLNELLYEFPTVAAGTRRVAPSPLTIAQTAVLRLLARGYVYKQIGRELGLATSTIRSHLQSIYQRLGVGDRAQAVLFATERGWLW